jgi:hypothetical protein
VITGVYCVRVGGRTLFRQDAKMADVASLVLSRNFSFARSRRLPQATKSAIIEIVRVGGNRPAAPNRLYKG